MFVFSSSRLLCGREQLSGSVGCSGLQSVSQSQQQIKYLAIVKGEFMCGRDNKYNRTSFFGGGGPSEGISLLIQMACLLLKVVVTS